MLFTCEGERQQSYTDDSFADVEDLSESESTPDALASYQTDRFYREHLEEDPEAAKGTRKRKAVDSGSSASESAPEYEEYAATIRPTPRYLNLPTPRHLNPPQTP
jgi:hypothetical protein